MDERHAKLSDMVIGSVDTLRGYDIDQLIPAEWNSEPPQLLKVHNPRIKDKPSQEEKDALLKSMLRVGVPTALRCAIWLSNIIHAIEPQQSNTYWLEYRTLSKVRSLDTAYDTIVRQVLVGDSSTSIGNTTGSSNEQPNSPSATKTTTISTTSKTEMSTDNNDNTINDIINKFNDWDMISTNTYGRKRINDDTILMSVDGITESGQIAIKSVLVAIDRIVTTDYAPLVPSIVAILLTVMSESYVFCSIREMLHQSARWYFPVSKIEHNAWCRAFVDIFKKLHPATAEYLDDRGVFDAGNLDPIFSNFFINILPMKYIHRIMDLYTLEGSKVLYRFGISLLVLYKIESAEQLITISNANEWWATMKHWTYNPKRFDFESIVRKA
jgi:Rab-GTPase-TBC domain